MEYTERLEKALFDLGGSSEDNEETSDKIIGFLNEAQTFRTFGEGLM